VIRLGIYATVTVLLGIVLIVFPARVRERLSMVLDVGIWPLRLIGAALLALSVFLILTITQAGS